MAFSLIGIFSVLLEAVRPYLLLILLVLALEAVFIVLVLRGHGRAWSMGRGPAVLGGMAFAVVAFFLAPWFTSASFGDFSGLLDWLSLIGGSIGAGVLAALLMWPLTTLLFGSRRPS